MPIIGWSMGRLVVDYISPLRSLGLPSVSWRRGRQDDFRSLRKGVRKGEGAEGSNSRLSLVLLSVATSIDALAVGLSIACLYPRQGISAARTVIGHRLRGHQRHGMLIGKTRGFSLGKRAEFLGGLILIGIGVNICSTICFH